MNASAAHPASSWSTTAIARLLDERTCPRCGHEEIRDHRCGRCGADFTRLGAELRRVASQRAALALSRRQSVLDRVPVHTASATPSHPPAMASENATARPLAAMRTASATVQSVLAAAGAGLVAIAAVVFAFFNPNLADSGVRAIILAAIAALFLAGAVALVRRRLRFSADAVGGLGLVFVALTLAASLPLLPGTIDPRVAGALTLLVAGGAFARAAIRLRLRVWLWSSLAALPFVSVLLGAASSVAIGSVLGALVAAACAAVLIGWTGRLRSRVGASLAPEIVTLSVLQLGFVLAAMMQSPFAALVATASAPAYAVSATAAAVCVIAVASAHHPAGGLWSTVAGGSGVIAACTAALGIFLDRIPPIWMTAIEPAAAAGMLVALGAARPLHRIVRAPFLFGGAIAALAVVAAPATLLAVLAIGGLGETSASIGLDTHVEPVATVSTAALALGLVAFARLTRGAIPSGTPRTKGERASEAGERAATGRRDAPSTSPAHDAASILPRTAWLGSLGHWYGVLALLLVLTLRDPAPVSAS